MTTWTAALNSTKPDTNSNNYSESQNRPPLSTCNSFPSRELSVKFLESCPSSRRNDPESARFVASIRLPRPSDVQFMRWGFAIWTGERTRATRPAMPVNRICTAQTAHRQRARLCSTWHAFLSGVCMETVRPFSRGRFGTYETESSQSFRCNKAGRDHGPSRSAGRHLSAWYSSIAIAVGRHGRGSGALHAGRRSRSVTIFLRDARTHDSRQA